MILDLVRPLCANRIRRIRWVTTHNPARRAVLQDRRDPLRFCETKNHARRLDTISVDRVKSLSMKFTHVRYLSHASIVFICCCISIVSAASAAVAPFSFPDWIELSPTNSPPARSYLAMTYDPVSGKIIAFGGFNGTSYLNDTWSFDGTSWAHIATQSAPPARTAAQMTYDSVTQKVVLFGGYNGTNYLGDTWLWDGSTLQWTQATPQHNPPAVTGPMLFPDPNGRADLFGGFDGHFYQLTMWQWNGSD